MFCPQEFFGMEILEVYKQVHQLYHDNSPHKTCRMIPLYNDIQLDHILLENRNIPACNQCKTCGSNYNVVLLKNTFVKLVKKM
jgi:hypothetical protein